MLHIVVNPVCGQGTAREFVQTHVESLLRTLGRPYRIYETRSVGDAAQIAREIDEQPADSPVKVRTVLIAGGDGTAHEFIEGVYRSGSRAMGKWKLALLPLGTANALYASNYPPSTPPRQFPPILAHHTPDDVRAKLYSLASLLGDDEPRRLPICLLTMTGGLASAGQSSCIPSHVVISTCLHANLLATAEGLREEYPGIERFKVAAQQNAGRFYPATVRLQPTSTGFVERYNPTTSTFQATEALEVEDDFAYFLSSATCPRLEPTFVISPLLQRIPTNSIEVTILRPSRDPRIKAVLRGYDSICRARQAGDQAVQDAASAAWVPRAWQVLGKAYEEGAHVDLTYTAEGEVEVKGEGEPVVEVYRVGGFSWTPLDESDTRAHLVCADGSLLDIPPGSSATVELDQSGGIYLCA